MIDRQEIYNAFPDYRFEKAFTSGQKQVFLVSRGDSRQILKVIELDRPGINLTPIDDELEDDASDCVQRLRREFSLMSRIHSQHIVQLESAPKLTEIDSKPAAYYFERYYPDGTLRDRLASSPLSITSVARLGIALLQAVDDMWTQERVVHRDIKPDNIVFDGENALLIDLGIAYEVDGKNITETGMPHPRTLLYGAPELFSSETRNMNHRTDQFSCGAVLYECYEHQHYLHELPVSNPLSVILGFSAEHLSFNNTPSPVRPIIQTMMDGQVSKRFRKPSMALAAWKKATSCS